jgi:ribosomal protein S6
MGKTTINDQLFEGVKNALSGNDDNLTDIIGPSAAKSIKTVTHSLRRIAIENIIEESPVQFRAKPFDPENDEKDAEFLDLIRNSGFVQTIMVQEIAGTGTGPFAEGKKYRQVYGHRRVAVFRYLRWKEIDALIAKPEEDVISLTFLENSGDKPLTQYERAMQLKKLHCLRPELNQIELAQKAGMDLSVTRVLLSAIDSPAELLKLFESGMSPRVVFALRPLFESTAESKRAFLAVSLEGCTREQAENLMSAVKDGRDPFLAIKMAGISPKMPVVQKAVSVEPIAPVTSPTDKPEPENTKTNNTSHVLEERFGVRKLVKPVQDENSASRLPSWIDADNEESLSDLATKNGITGALARVLIIKARDHRMDQDDLNSACVFTAIHGDAGQAISDVLSIDHDPRGKKALKKYVESIHYVLNVIKKCEVDHATDVANALRSCIVNPMDVKPAKLGKKK